LKLGAAKYEGWKRMAEKEAARVKDFVERSAQHQEEVRLKVNNAALANAWFGVREQSYQL